MCGITACPPHKDIHKTALGATENVRWEYRHSILELTKEYKSLGWTICAIEQAEETFKRIGIPYSIYNRGLYLELKEQQEKEQQSTEITEVVIEEQPITIIEEPIILFEETNEILKPKIQINLI